MRGAAAGMGRAGANSGHSPPTPAPTPPSFPVISSTLSAGYRAAGIHLPPRCPCRSFPGRHSVLPSPTRTTFSPTKLFNLTPKYLKGNVPGGGAGGGAEVGANGRVAGGSLQRGRECPAFPKALA